MSAISLDLFENNNSNVQTLAPANFADHAYSQFTRKGTMSTKRFHQPLCYISADSSVNIDRLTRAVEQRGIRVVRSDSVPVGSPIIETIRDAIDKADIVIGVLTAPIRNANVYYEIGMASGLRKKTLLFSTEDESLPRGLKQHYVVRAALSNNEAVEFALDQILSAPLPLFRQAKLFPILPEALGTEADKYLVRLNNLPEHGAPRQLERLVRDLLEACAVDVVSETNTRNFYVDFAVWSDAFETSIGNPLLIEVKSSINRPRDADTVSARISKYIDQVNAKWGLILYNNGLRDDHPVWRELPRSVMAIQIRRLITELSNHSLPDVIRQLRNRRVHEMEN